MTTSAESALIFLLKGNGNSPPGSAVTAIVGNRIYWDRLPQNVSYPAIRLQRISTNYGDDRSIDAPADYVTVRFQIDGWALDRLAAINLGAAVFSVMEQAACILGDIRVDPCIIEDEAGDLEEGIAAGGADVYRERIELFLPYQRLAA